MIKRLLFLFLLLVSYPAFSQETIRTYLSGTDKDHTRQWDFYCTGGRKSGVWSKIPVPSNWELQGFGSYNYGHDKDKAKEQGLYRCEFTTGKITGKKIFIVFEGSMTDTKVTVNGKLAGEVHQGGFYRFRYDITTLLKAEGKNKLEVTVDKMSANASINSAERKSDFWVFGGIFRPVYLETVPDKFIERVAVNAKADGSFQLDVYGQNLGANDVIEAQVKKLNGENVGKAFSVKANLTDSMQTLKSSIPHPSLWSSEFPNLYQVVVRVKNKRQTIHQVKQKFGFRTLEVRRNDGFYVNGVKILLKGVNRHSFWPETGRTLSKAVHLMDVRLMKEMNMNAVRMSHYPPDAEFLDVCDSLGLYVINELTGWQAKYDNSVGHKLVKELVIRDVNHPSIIFWANGNEGGFNTDLDNDYAMYDPQKRTVIHPWEKFNGTDTKHYPDYNYMVKAATSGKEVFFPTEFMHALYDGGAGAALDDFWNQMMLHPHGAGGFIWALVDENVIRTDKNGIYDGDGNHAPDGIVGPHREKEGSFYAIKEIWSPVFVDLPKIDEKFNGKISIANRFDFTSFNQCTFKWKLVNFPSAKDVATKATVNASGSAISNLKPGIKGILDLSLPKSWAQSDALYLTAYGPDQKEIFTWSWPIKAAQFIARKQETTASSSAVTAEEKDQSLLVKQDGITYYFDKTTGYIEKVLKPNAAISLSKGPLLAGVKMTLKNFTFKAVGQKYTVESDYEGAGHLNAKWTFEPGKLVKLEYQFSQQGDADFMGITFNYPEEKITGMKYLGRGPYRVWKNRLKGQQFGVWHKDYNNTITGESWGYPEFKGYHGEVNWVVFENKEATFTVYTPDQDTYLQMYRSAREAAALSNNNVEPAFPDGSIGFLKGISAIGTKFQSALVMGPQSQKYKTDGKTFSGTLLFDFIH
ncbi:glycoside hydrolase family 2 [Pedobacter frigidisoli]|uniref:beta-galactosidase n=1 Tax=Pedobacter frigidisoli TaxID=2530455 RepID=A0A4R0P2K7_9SPHI|nr:glycoside hydrolase family 2 TIM barrel-domain containing protein [Pedobacter frigidisoli]TCD11044.1 glycoside hydrolase family 2 [Pedobacter frigidisoli]